MPPACPTYFARQRALTLILVAIGGMLLSGCTTFGDYIHNGFKVGPNYGRPQAPVATDWINASDQRFRSDDDHLDDWWTVFNDPVLNTLVINTYDQNLTLREAGFRVLQARAARGIAVGTLFPQVQECFGGFSRNQVSKRTANSSFLPNRYFDQWDFGFDMAWELDFWGRFRRAIEAADADLDESVESYDDVLVTLIGDVAATYVEVRTLQRRITLAKANVELQTQTLGFANARFKGGTASELDVDQAQSNLSQTKALIPQLEISLRQAENRLCVLMGMPPEELTSRLGSGPIPVAPVQVAIGVPASLLSRRPDIRAAERRVAAQSARVGVATTDLYPHIAITGTIAVSSEKFSNLLQNEAVNGSLGPSFRWNILNYGRLRNNIRLQDAKLEELIATYQQTVLIAHEEVENGLIQFLKGQERAQNLDDSVVASDKAVKISLAQYKGGAVDFNRVALVEQNLVTQQDLQTQAQGAIAQGLIQAFRALGGGWQIRYDDSAARGMGLPEGRLPPAPELQEPPMPREVFPAPQP